MRRYFHLVIFACGSALMPERGDSQTAPDSKPGEFLYNGIQLPAVWPPRIQEPKSRDEVRSAPYLATPPAVIPIDVGRQLFVDDFLIEKNELKRVFHQPVKYHGNPVLKPETALENNNGFCPSAAPFSDGCFYDPADQLYKLWYMAGWMGGVALATSRDGLHWTRPEFDVMKGTNAVTDQSEPMRRDGVSIWLDYAAAKPSERFKMLQFQRTGLIGQPGLGKGMGYLQTSPDGVHWTRRGALPPCGDNTTMFYNPFRKVWVLSCRNERKGFGRMREYWENSNFFACLHEWTGYAPVYWQAVDRLDPAHSSVGDPTELYKIDATPYESIMLGLLQIHYGPINEKAAAVGIPKLTQLQVGFSRDGFYWDRPSRETFIGATMKKDSWERAYVTSTGGGCLVVGDSLYFYYTALQGDESKPKSEKLPNSHWTGMYANASTGLAILRRDGFASLDASDATQTVTTRPVRFNGRHPFVNVACAGGELRAEILDESGHVIEPFTTANSTALATDSTCHSLAWSGAANLAAVAGRPVRFRFHLKRGSLFSFWVSPEPSGASHGYVAAGGPGFTGPVDTVGALRPNPITKGLSQIGKESSVDKLLPDGE